MIDLRFRWRARAYLCIARKPVAANRRRFPVEEQLGRLSLYRTFLKLLHELRLEEKRHLRWTPKLRNSLGYILPPGMPAVSEPGGRRCQLIDANTINKLDET